jgi:hypothetical protein
MEFSRYAKVPESIEEELKLRHRETSRRGAA